MDYFLSYSRADQRVAGELADALEGAGHSVFLDTRHIAPGDRWDASIQQHLRDSKAVVVLLSPDAVRSDNVLDEVGFALDLHKLIVPVIIRPCDVPLRLRRFEWLAFDGRADRIAEELAGRLSRGMARREPGHDETWERPSVVVLPFRGLSAVRDTEALCDGLLYGIIESLSHNKEFFVIAAGTSLTYKADAPNLGQIANELGVRYAVSGTLQCTATRVRVTFELCNAVNECVILSNHHEGELEDHLAFQEAISRAIAVELQPRLTRAEIKRVARKSPTELNAWELFMRARTYNWSRDWLHQSIELLERAIAIDPAAASARALLAARFAYLIWYGEFENAGRALEQIDKALELDPNDSFIQVASCIVHMHLGNARRALESSERALETNPNLAEAWAYHGACLGLTGENRRGLEQLDMAFRLSPKDPLRYIWYLFRMVCLVGDENYEEAAKAGEASIRLNREWFFVEMSQAVNYAMLDRAAEARAAWAQARHLNSQVSVDAYRLWLANSQLSEAHRERLIAALKRVGCE